MHLDVSRTETYEKCLQFLDSIQSDAEELYLLGDLFEYWIGDDAVDIVGHRPFVTAMQNLSANGIRILVMHGNRDFLLGNQFTNQFNGTLIPDPYVIKINGQSVLLMHGDSLCTDDIEHQKYRKIVLSPEWQQQILQLDIAERQRRAIEMRSQSENTKTSKSMEIMDVNLDAVKSVMREYKSKILVHGHVHKANVHAVEIDGEKALRYVLGDWDSGNDAILKVDSEGKFHLLRP